MVQRDKPQTKMAVTIIAMQQRSIKVPPSPPKLPLIGHLHHLGALPHHSLRALSQTYGIHLYFSGIISKNGQRNHEDTRCCFLQYITTAVKEFLYGGKDVVFAPLGEYWREMRKVCVKDLLSLKRVQSFEFIREEEIANMFNKINQACLMKSDLNLTDLISVIANNIISRVTLGRSLEGKSEGAKLIKEVVEHFGLFCVGDIIPSLGWIDELTGIKNRMRKTSTAMHRLFR
ncbi:Cytochrome p450 [Thalictrum thalictroides]|uniref:Cytochrome p450 n=1 Tax=Thalictrum thalictroides TaxID=46969 RepID=A0A7J6X9L2_THATH|nr:Cytochrome p450 [Thalictrum thalictroides]